MSSPEENRARGLTVLQFSAQSLPSEIEVDPISVVSSSPVMYELSLNVYGDVRKKDKARKEVAELAGVSGERASLAQFHRFANQATPTRNNSTACSTSD